MSIHTNYRVSCERYSFGLELGLSDDENYAAFPISRCLVLSKHPDRPGGGPVREWQARADADAAGWIRIEHPYVGEPHTFDLCPECAPKAIELLELKVAEAVLLS